MEERIPDSFTLSSLIESSPKKVWSALTEQVFIKKWMGDPELNLEIITDWKVNHPVIIKGFHHIHFENRGIVLKFVPEKKLIYTQLSSLSRLEDKMENHSVLDFTLIPEGENTLLTLNMHNFPTETIYKHLEFYWRTTMETIKNFVEVQSA